MDREAWRAVIHGVTKSWTWMSDWTELNWSLHHMKFCQNRHISWCFVWITIRLWKVENSKAPSCLITITHFIGQLSKLLDTFSQIPEYLEIKRRQAWSWKWLSTVLQPGCVKPAHSLHSRTHQLRILCWARNETFPQYQHLTSFLFHYIFPFYIRQLKNDQQSEQSQSVWLCGSQLTVENSERWEYQTTWPASWETCMQVRKQ